MLPVLKKYKAIIFDLDGTLYDSSRLPLRLITSEFIEGSLTKLAAERKVRKEIAGKHYESEYAFYDDFFTRISLKASCSKQNARDWYFNNYLHNMVKQLKKHYHAREGLNEFLLSIKQDHKLVVFSDYSNVLPKLSALKIDTNLFDLTFDGPKLGGLKPCKESFLYIAEKLGLSPNEILVVGDRLDTDGKGAIDSGMGFIHIHKATKPSKKKIKKYKDAVSWEEFTYIH